MKKLLLVLFVTFITAEAFAQVKTTSNPYSVKFVTTDIDLYWKMYHHFSGAKSTADSTRIIQNEYLDKGSTVLKDRMNEQGGISAVTILHSLRKFPVYIASIENSTRQIANYKQQVISDFKKLKAIYPAAVFPDYYFIMGDFNSGGRPLNSGMYIGAEIMAADKGSPYKEFQNYSALQHGMRTVDQLEAVCCHELIHWQQDRSTTSLLGLAISEGAADFVGEKISGKLITTYQHQYGDLHEKEIWHAFTADNASNNIRQWLFNGGEKNLKIPADMGYYIGYRICEAYYNKTPDKKKAISDILQIKDFNAFLKKSGYGVNF